MVPLRPSRRLHRLPQVKAHLRRPVPRPGSPGSSRSVLDQWFPPWPASPSSISFA
jgi:hypothetical protein